MREEASSHRFLKKITLNYLEKEKFQDIMRKKKLLQNLYLNLRNTTTNFFYQAIDMVVNCIRNRFQQKGYIETLQTMEILLLKALRKEDFGHELQQMSSFFSSDLDKFKLETQLKILTRIADEKQVRIKDAIKIISSLNASQKYLKWLSLLSLSYIGPATKCCQ